MAEWRSRRRKRNGDPFHSCRPCARKLYLNVFSEQYNGDYKTDYASAFDTVTLTVVDTIAPTLTADSASRDSETDATVRFTSDEAGTYYYAVVESGDTAPTIDTTVAGTSCDTTEQTISLTNLSGAGAKDIYIVAKRRGGECQPAAKNHHTRLYRTQLWDFRVPAALNFAAKRRATQTHLPRRL